MHTLALPKSVFRFERGPQRLLAHSELAYLIKKKFIFGWSLPARPPYTTSCCHTLTDTHTTLNPQQVMEHVPAFVLCLWEQNPGREIFGFYPR